MSKHMGQCGEEVVALLDEPGDEQAIRAFDVDAQIWQRFEQGVQLGKAGHIVSNLELSENGHLAP